MKKLFLFAIGFYFAIIKLFAQHTDFVCDHQPSQDIAMAGSFCEFGYGHVQPLIMKLKSINPIKKAWY